jgi:hypothetical protein
MGHPSIGVGDSAEKSVFFDFRFPIGNSFAKTGDLAAHSLFVRILPSPSTLQKPEKK